MDKTTGWLFILVAVVWILGPATSGLEVLSGNVTAWI